MYEAIVAGVDGSRCAFDAAMWAAEEARLRHLRLELVHVVDPHDRQRSDEDGGRLLRGEADRLGEAFPEVKVWPLLLHGPPGRVLLAETGRVGFAVLGRHGVGGADALPEASTAYDVVGHTPHPVVIVPEGCVPSPGPVVVGVDGSDRTAHALRFAFAEAALRGRPLRTVHVLRGKARAGDTADLRMPDNIRRLTAAVLAGRHAENPSVDVTEEAHRGDPAEILTALGQESALLVVGARGHDGLRTHVFGSVSRDIVHNARCPLAVVRR